MRDSRLIFILGKRGSGKSLTATLFALFYKLKGFKVYSNMQRLKLADGHVKDYNKHFWDDNDSDTPKVLIIDEAQKDLDSRRAMSDDNIGYTNIITQSRKNNLDIIITSTRYHNIDVRVRDIVDYYILPHFNKKNNILTLYFYDDTQELVRIKKYHIPNWLFSLYDTTEKILPDTFERN